MRKLKTPPGKFFQRLVPKKVKTVIRPINQEFSYDACDKNCRECLNQG